MTADHRLLTAVCLSATRLLLCFVFITLCIAQRPSGAALTQEKQQDGPVYVVQEGDTLWSIAQRFGVSVDDLANANGIQNASLLKAGDKLVIPGLQGIKGEQVGS